MGCVSAPVGFTVQSPACGIAIGWTLKNQCAVVALQRRPSTLVASAHSATKEDNKVLLSNDTGFKSTFDEYLKAMESIRADREKKKTPMGSTGQKMKAALSEYDDKDLKRKEINQSNTSRGSDSDEEWKPSRRFHSAADKEVLDGRKKKTAVSEYDDKDLNRKERNQTNTFRRSDSNEEWKSPRRSHSAADKEVLDGGIQSKPFVRLQKDVSRVSFKKGPIEEKDGPINKLSVDSSAIKISQPWSRSTEIKRTRTDNKLKLKNYGIQPFDILDEFEDNQISDVAQNRPRVTRREMEERIQKLAECLNDADIDLPEWRFSETMRNAEIRFSDYSMLRVIQILGKLGNWRQVLQVVEWLQMQERYKSQKIRYVYTAALDVLGKARRPVQALNLFCAMQRHKASYPDIVAYHSIAVTLGQAGHLKELFGVIDSMRSVPNNLKTEMLQEWDPRLEPDIVVYNAVLNACAMREEWEGAIWVLQKLSQVGQQPSNTTYGLVMEVMLACGKYEMVHEYFKEMQKSFAPNALTYRVIVNALWREGKPDEAIKVVRDMESRGIVGSASVYYDLARCLCSAGRRAEALMQVDKICKVASKPLVVTYTGLIKACADGGHIHDGTAIFDYMQKYCFPNLVTYNVMLKAYLGHGMFDEAKELFQKMIQARHSGGTLKSKIRPDVHTFNLMLDASIWEERWDDFEFAYEQMLLHGHPFNKKYHLWMVMRASSAGKAEVVETTWRHLLRTKRVLPSTLIKERFKVKMESDDLVEAVSSIASHASCHQPAFSKKAWSKLLEDNAHCFKRKTLEQLMSDVSKSLSQSESPNPIYQNLLDSCTEFVTRLDIIENPSIVHTTKL